MKFVDRLWTKRRPTADACYAEATDNEYKVLFRKTNISKHIIQSIAFAETLTVIPHWFCIFVALDYWWFRLWSCFLYNSLFSPNYADRLL